MYMCKKTASFLHSLISISHGKKSPIWLEKLQPSERESQQEKLHIDNAQGCKTCNDLLCFHMPVSRSVETAINQSEHYTVLCSFTSSRHLHGIPALYRRNLVTRALSLNSRKNLRNYFKTLNNSCVANSAFNKICYIAGVFPTTHMTSNNETVSHQMPWTGNIAKTMMSNR